MEKILNRKVLSIFSVAMFLMASISLSVAPTYALSDKFTVLDNNGDGLNDVVIRMPQNPRANKPFNIGIYITDALVSTAGDGSGGDPDLAELYISVTNLGTATGWNDWFVEDAAWFDTDVPPVLDLDETLGDPDDNNQIDPADDLIGTYYWVDPDESLSWPTPTITGDEYLVTSMDYGAQSKLGYQDGWSGSTVWTVTDPGMYTFTLSSQGTVIYSFTVTVS